MTGKEKIQVKLGEQVTRLRRAKGYSIHELAAASGLEYSHVQRIEKGKVNVAFTTLVALSEGLEIEVWELLREFKR